LNLRPLQCEGIPRFNEFYDLCAGETGFHEFSSPNLRRFL
jgi:hypothetical protein